MHRNNKIIVGSLSLYFLVLPFILLAKDEKFIYNSHKREDPFYPIISETGEFLSKIEQQKSQTKKLLVEGIVWDSGKNSIAIINGTVVRQGDKIEGYQVLEIRKDGVLLERDGEKEILTMPNEEGE